MDELLHLLARWFVSFIQGLSLPGAARLGRMGGALAYRLDGRHRRVALANLTMCFGNGKSPAEIRALARENFRRIGESYACAIKTAVMTADELKPHVSFEMPPSLRSYTEDPNPPNLVFAIGHFGNFELYARFGSFTKAYQCVTTYRALRQPLINDVLQSLRNRSGCIFFERRFEAAALKATMNQPRILLGLLADQNGGQGGLKLPFMGHNCSTSAAPAIFALRYRCALYTAACYRVGPAQWRLEAGEQIPTHENGLARSTAEIMADVNRAFETAVRRDPANWFWVHNRWKQFGAQTPGSLIQDRGNEEARVASAGMTAVEDQAPAAASDHPDPQPPTADH